MSDTPDTSEAPNEETWSFQSPAEFFAAAEKDEEYQELGEGIKPLLQFHDVTERQLLVRCLVLLQAVTMSLPEDKEDGLDTVRADVARRFALPSLRDLIAHLLCE